MVCPRGMYFYIGYIAKNLRKYSSHEPLAGMYFDLAWIILGTRRFKFYAK